MMLGVAQATTPVPGTAHERAVFDEVTLATLDPSGLWRRIADLPRQAAEAWALGSSWSGPTPARVSRVVVMGMGGSAIGAQLAARIVQERSTCPIEVVRDSDLPAMDADTLQVFCSFSGETDEVLTAFQASLKLRTPKLVITRGGELGRRAEAEGIPALRYDYDGEPRSALGYGLMLLLGVLHRLGIYRVTEDEVTRALHEVDACSRPQHPDRPLAENSARALALQMSGATPVILADASLGGAAVRWQNQCNENGKRWAFAGVVPEALHNIVEGIRLAPAGDTPPFHVVLLEDLSRPRASRARLDALQDLLSETSVRWTRLPFAGDSALSILLQACIVGDWVSYYLAIEHGVNPSPVPTITMLKNRIADSLVPTAKP